MSAATTAVLAINSSGVRSIVSRNDTGTGTGNAAFSSLAHVMVNPAGEIYVTDNAAGTGRVIKIDPATGNRTVVTGGGVGSGQAFASPGGTIYGLAWDTTTSTILVADFGSSAATTAVIRVDPSTGARTLVSRNGTGTGTSFAGIRTVAVDPSGNIYAGDNNVGVLSIFKIDPATGNRTVISGGAGAAGSGTAFVNSTLGISWDGSTGTLLVGDQGSSSANTALYRVDPSTGARTVLASPSIGTGTTLQRVQQAVVSAGTIYIVGDAGANSSVLTLNPSTLVRAAFSGNGAGSGTSGSSTWRGLVVYASAPTVSSVSATTANGSYKAGVTIAVTVSFNQTVYVTGTPRVALNSGGSAFANYAGGSGTATLTFNYVVGAGDTSADLDYTSTSALTLNGGTVLGLSGFSATLTLASPGAANSLGANKAIVIDTTAPSITSATTAAATYGTAGFSYTITATDTNGIASYNATGLPAGLGINTSTGVISGTPTTNGVASVTISATDAAGNTGSTTLTLTVNKKALTVTGITANDKIYDGATTATLVTGGATLVGVLGGDTVSLSTSGASGVFSSAAVGTGKTVTISGLTISGASSGNYTLTQPTTTAAITVKTLTSSGLTAVGKVYDGQTTATLSGTAALPGAEAVGAGTTSDGKPYTGDTVSLSGTASGSFADRHVGTAKPVTVSGLSLSGAQAGNYTLTQPTGLTATITVKTLTASGVTAVDKVYDGQTTATLSGTAALPGAEAVGAGTASDGKPYTGDTVSLSGTASGSFADRHVGTAKPVTVSGLSLSGAQAGNYTLTQPTGLTATITVKTLTASGVTAVDKVYDGQTTATLSGTAALPGAEAVGAGTTSDGKPYTGDTVSLSGTASGSFADRHVGTAKPVTVSGLSLSGAQAGNYTLTQPTGLTATITVKTLTSSGVTAVDKVYDGQTTATLSGTAALPGAEAVGAGTTSDGKPYTGDTVSLSGTASGSFADRHVGTAKPVTVSGLSLSGAQAGNYTLTQPTGLTATITAAALTVTGLTANDKIYDTTTTATLVTASAVLNGIISPDSVTLVVAGGTGTFDAKDVGAGKTVTVAGLTLGGTDAGDYALTQPAATASITAKGLTVTADDHSRVYGVANPSLTATITGYAGGENSSVLTGSPGITTTATPTSVPGSYAIVAAIGTLAANHSNYTFSFANGTLTITALTYADWKAQMFTVSEQANPAISGPDADPDHDGITNLLEYAFDLVPTQPDVSGLPTAGLVTVSGSNYLAITYTRLKVSSDLTYAVAASADLVTWTPLTPVEVGVTDHGNTETVVTRDTVATTATSRRFLRVTATIP